VRKQNGPPLVGQPAKRLRKQDTRPRILASPVGATRDGSLLPVSCCIGAGAKPHSGPLRATGHTRICSRIVQSLLYASFSAGRTLWGPGRGLFYLWRRVGPAGAPDLFLFQRTFVVIPFASHDVTGNHPQTVCKVTCVCQLPAGKKVLERVLIVGGSRCPWR